MKSYIYEDMNIQILRIIHGTTVDGPGFRTSIYCAGCCHQCPGCHNPQSWDFGVGHPVTIDELIEDISSDPFSNVTLSGGDPMYQAEGIAELCRRIKTETDKTIWCYTGFTYEALSTMPDTNIRDILSHIDVLVDGPFVLAQRDADLLFRGSSNQRLIDVQQTRMAGHICLWHREGFNL